MPGLLLPGVFFKYGLYQLAELLLPLEQQKRDAVLQAMREIVKVAK